MGCDYYILKVLQVYYQNGVGVGVGVGDFEIEVERQRRYFDYENDNFDEDEENYEEKLAEYKRGILTPCIQPITIYSNNTFNKELTEIKYRELVEHELSDRSIKWSALNKIIKIEIRYER
jgi:hypothetical protein